MKVIVTDKIQTHKNIVIHFLAHSFQEQGKEKKYEFRKDSDKENFATHS